MKPEVGVWRIEERLFYFMLVDEDNNRIIYSDLDEKSRGAQKAEYTRWAEIFDEYGAEKAGRYVNLSDIRKNTVKSLFTGWLL